MRVRNLRRRLQVVLAMVALSAAVPAAASGYYEASGATRAVTPTFVFGIAAMNPLQPVRSAADVSYLGGRVARVEVASTASLADIRPIKQAFDARGIEVILLASRPKPVPAPPSGTRWDAGPLPEHAANLAAWAKTFGPGGLESSGHPVHQIEFGNENGGDYEPKVGPTKGATYANNYRAAYDAINGPNGNSNVGLLAQGDAQEGQVGPWVSGMFSAQPGMATMVADNAGWVAHPYGPRWKQKLDPVVDETEKQGAPSSIPIFITEWGLANTSDGRCLIGGNYGWDACMDYQEAVDPLRSTVQGMQADPKFGCRIALFTLYQQHDQLAEPGQGPSDSAREHYFGALKTPDYGLKIDPTFGQRDKGAYTAEVKRQASAAPLCGTPRPPPPPPPLPPHALPVLPSQPPTLATVDVAAPVLSSVTANPHSFRSGSLLPRLARRAPVGTTIKFTLSEPASTKVEFLQSRPGRKVGNRCKAPTRPNRSHKLCTRTVVVGSLTMPGHTGNNHLRFQGSVSSHKTLKPGRYTVRIAVTDAAGNAAKAMSTTITILKG